MNRSKALVMTSVNRSSPITKYHIGKCSVSLCLGLSLSTQYWLVQLKESMDEAREQKRSIDNDSEQVISKHHVSHWQVFSKLVPRAELVYPILVGSVEEKHVRHVTAD